MAKQLLLTAEQMKDRSLWLETRNKYIGGSDAAVVVGLSNYKKPFALWAEKSGKVVPEDISDKLHVKFGNYAEEFVAQLFCEETGKKTRRTGLYINDKYPWACASLDRMIIGEETFLECKTTGSWNGDVWEGDNIPDSYYCQIVHYLTVMEMEKCYIACLIGNGKFVWKEIVLNKADAEALMEAERKFWELVQTDTPPQIDETESCTAILNEKFHGGLTDAIDLPSEAAEIITSLDTFNKQASDLKAVIDLSKNRLREILGDHELGYVGDRKITWKLEGAKGNFNTAGLKKEFPDVYNKFYTPGEKKRVLRIASAKNNED